MKNISLVAAILFLAAGGFLILQHRSLTPSVMKSGNFISTYMPTGWKVTEHDAVISRIESPDYMTASSLETQCGDAGGADCGPTMVQGAQFVIAYDPCLYSESVSDFRTREAQNAKDLIGLVEQKPITIAGHSAVLFHTQNLSKTAHPAMIDMYSATFITSPPACQDVNFSFAESTSTNYGSELNNFLNGLQFVETKN